MVNVKVQGDKYKCCNSCFKKEGKFIEISYGNKCNYSVFTLCEKCQDKLIEKLWEVGKDEGC